MTGTISFGGIGSGMDTEGIVTALVGVERQGETALQTKLTANNSSISNLSSVSSLLSKLKAASDALDTTAEVGSYKATSSNAAIVASSSGLASAGKYSITVDKLAKEQRTYSNTIASVGTALGQAGTLKLGVGSGTTTDVSILATDTLDDVIGKINASGQRITASSFYDGTSYRIQLRGQDSGAANALSITETGTTFGFTVPANTVQAAQDAQIKLDGFTIKSATNQVTGAIRGVTLALTAETTDAVTVGIENDPDALKTKLNTLVDSYNAVVSKIKDLAGNGTVKAKDANLAGDSMLRSINQRIAGALQTVTSSSATYGSLGSIGLALDRSGKLSLDSTKFSKAMAADPDAVTKVLAGAGTGGLGVMGAVSSTVDLFTKTGTGIMAGRTDAMNATTKRLQSRIDREEIRINRYADQLRKQFTQMDTTVASWNAQSSYLSQL
ncbi:MAG: flagellar filament capping protein FliD [Myxococcales bacterium]